MRWVACSKLPGPWRADTREYRLDEWVDRMVSPYGYEDAAFILPFKGEAIELEKMSTWEANNRASMHVAH